MPPKGFKKNAKKTDAAEVSEVAKKKPADVVPASEAMRDQLRASILKEYEYMLGAVPDRTVDLFPLHIPSLNKALGGGFPRGQIIHVYGTQGAGKSTLAFHIAASVQAQGGHVLYFDSEVAAHAPYVQGLGINIDPSKFTHVKNLGGGEIALDLAEKAVRSNTYELIVFDSVAALAPASILDASNEQQHIGTQARMMSQALLKLNNAASKSGTIILFVNQLRANINQFGHGKAYTVPGGNALRYYSNIEMHMQRVGEIKEGEEIIGQRVRIRIEKNKIAPPYREVICNLIYGDGFRRDADLILSAIDKGIIKQAGSWYKLGEETIGQGLASIKQYAKEHPEFLDMLEERLYGKLLSGNAPSKLSPDAITTTGTLSEPAEAASNDE
jgi:recombination protein RecA